MPYTTRVWGPPGTGKTTYLLSEVDKSLAHGTAPDTIGYYAFTRGAAGEATDRALHKFPELDKYDLAHFRTIHSECYRLLGLRREDVLTHKHLTEFAKAYGYKFSSSKDSFEQRQELVLQTRDDYLMFFEEWRRAKRIDDFTRAYREFAGLDPFDCPPLHWLIQFSKRYGDFKQQNRLYDFTDMLTTVLHERLAPGLKAMFVDECQDLNPLEFEVIMQWAAGCDSLHLCGDPLQAIYVFQGAEPELFFSIPCDRKLTITQSYRVPQKVHMLSMQLARRTTVGVELEYKPTPEEGFVAYKSDMWSVPMDGSRTFILSRNRCYLEEIEERLLNAGIPFISLRGMNLFGGKLSKAIYTAYVLSKGSKALVSDINILIQDFIPSKPWLKHGAKTIFADLASQHGDSYMGMSDLLNYVNANFLNIVGKGMYWNILKGKEGEFEYFRRIVERHGIEVLNSKPNIILGTQHSVKGMECDIVVCLSDMTRRTYRSYYTAPDREIPCWYVAVTRAKKGVYILEPQGGNFFDW